VACRNCLFLPASPLAGRSVQVKIARNQEWQVSVAISAAGGRSYRFQGFEAVSNTDTQVGGVLDVLP